MGSRSNEITVTDDMAINTIDIPIDKIKITAIGLACKTASISPTAAYCEVSIMSGSKSSEAIGSKLASGYIGSNHSISWQGRITGDASQYLVANIWSDTIATFRLTILSE